MVFIKYIVLSGIFIGTSAMGLMIANKFKERVNDLKQIRNILNILKTKIIYTYEPLPQVFEYIAQEFPDGIGEIFFIAMNNMKNMPAGEAWRLGIAGSNTYLNDEDLSILCGLDKMLGKTNADGQVSEIELMEKFIDTQIEKAMSEQRKNEKLYRNLGVIVGIGLVIILI